MKLTTIQLELIAAKAKQLAKDYDSGRIWPSEFEKVLQEIAEHVEKARNAAQSIAPVDDDLATVIEQRGPTVIRNMTNTTEEIAFGVLNPSKSPAEGASADDWVRAIAPLMQADFKDWYQNSTREWPRITAEVIKGLRESEAFWIEQASRVRPNGTPVAWCELTSSGQIAYFDGKPMVMVGPVGNDCHPHPLYLCAAQST